MDDPDGVGAQPWPSPGPALGPWGPLLGPPGPGPLYTGYKGWGPLGTPGTPKMGYFGPFWVPTGQYWPRPVQTGPGRPQYAPSAALDWAGPERTGTVRHRAGPGRRPLSRSKELAGPDQDWSGPARTGPDRSGTPKRVKNGSFWGSKMGPKMGPFWTPKLTHFWTPKSPISNPKWTYFGPHFWAIFGPKMGPKMGQKGVKIGVPGVKN